jgi:tRNA1Val (adenine37-N6)-methyltransferase
MKSTFEFKQFTIQQQNSSMKVTSDAVLLGAYAAYHHPFSQINPSSTRLLDIGCGTGLLSLILAQKIATLANDNDGVFDTANCLSIDAIDIDAQALNDAAQNCAHSQWQSKVQLYNRSIVDMPLALEKTHEFKRYRLIICNPPFYHNNKPSNDLKRNLAWHLSNGLSPSVLAKKTLELLCHQGEAYFLWPTIEAEQFVETLRKANIANNANAKKQNPLTDGSTRTNIGVHIHVIDLIHKPGSASKRSVVKVQLQQASESQVDRSTLNIFDENQNYYPEVAQMLRPYYRFID